MTGAGFPCRVSTVPVSVMDSRGILLLTVETRSGILVFHMGTNEPTVRFNVQLLAEDMAAKGWNKLDLSVRAGVADMTVIRFLRGDCQTARTAKKLAKALGYSVRRYLLSSAQPGV